ncbi:MAG: glycoside hydrolase family 15 protein [Ornithinimicrobium sp.]|uniref:glycoside hydrolase family 15 protein n=1 Tax=Ornithinimicrobium sp. TaxID=1977084 RepID=UPI0026E0798D|nr:glycoside hydrolase family 15 protein [Ornithinimicrobium sp.]MDO5738930.1 glycoside hydrolase family 15 protein [Ornithinimicrobium sp.]
MSTDTPQPVPIGDYAFVGDLRTAALISPTGSVDWLCLPRFDSPSVFSALLGTPDNGRWLIGIVDGRVEGRDYLEDTFVLRTRWRAPGGTAEVLDWMPIGQDCSDLVRHVRCTEGTVEVEHDLCMRFSYGDVVPWVQRIHVDREDGSTEEVLHAVGGPAALALHGPLPTAAPGEQRHRARHTLRQGEELIWVLTGQDSWRDVPPMMDVATELDATIANWHGWASSIDAHGPWAGQVRRSLLVLRALTHADTGGIVAAATTSLPEELGGSRNWDYRYTWLRDSALTLEATMAHGFDGGAAAWRQWLLRAVAGDPQDMLIMYGVGGERDLLERELPHLAGYAASRPVRVGNGAVGQYQADVIGEVLIALAQLRDGGREEDKFSWALQRAMLDVQTRRFDQPDHGIWEMRGEPHFFTHGRVMMWAGFDQAVRAVEEHGLSGDVDQWRQLRGRLREEIEERGIGPDGAFRQAYGNTLVDASLLQIPQTGFVAYDDPRMLATVARIEAELVDDHGYVHRYRTGHGMDGLPGGEASFLICSFWLVEQYAHSGRLEVAKDLMNKLTGTAGELGLLAEQYDPVAGRMLGNYPQAFSHLGLIRAASAIELCSDRPHPEPPGARYGTAARVSDSD